jgi:hypothetical protein
MDGSSCLTTPLPLHDHPLKPLLKDLPNNPPLFQHPHGIHPQHLDLTELLVQRLDVLEDGRDGLAFQEVAGELFAGGQPQGQGQGAAAGRGLGLEF